MSDKAVSKQQAPKELSGDEVADKELASVSDRMFDDTMSGMKQAFRFGVAVAEKMDDNNAAFWGGMFGHDARESHTKQLEDEAMDALKHGRTDAAQHLLKRDVEFTAWTQGYNDADTQRLLKEINSIQQAEKQAAKHK